MVDYIKLHNDFINKGTFSKLILDSSFESVFTKSPDGIITSWNQGAEKIYGYKANEIIGKSVNILVPQEKSEELTDVLKKVNKGERVVRQKTQRISKDGTLVEVIISIIPIYDDGKIIGATVFQSDLSMQKEIERKYYDLFEQAPDAIFIADLNGRYTEVNTSAIKMLGYPKEELIGKTILDLIPPVEAERLQMSREILLKPGEIQIAEWHLKKKDGNYIPVEVSTSILKDGRWQAFVRDLSEQKETERKFGFIFESAPDAMIIINQEGTIQMVNGQCEEMLGYLKAELIGQKIEILVPEEFRSKHPANREKFISEFKRRRMASGLNLRARKKDGSEISVDIVLSPMRLEKETIVLASIRDLTGLKELSNYARNLLEASPDPFIVTDLSGIITDANKAASDKFGFEIEKLSKVTLATFFTDSKGLEDYALKIINFEKVKEIPLTAKDGKGNLIDCLVSASVYKDLFGKAEGVFYVLKDISELVKIAGKMISEAAKV